MITIRKYWKSILWALIIAFLLFTPGNKFPDSKFLNFEHTDKIIHLILFMVFVLLMCLEGLKGKIQPKYYYLILIVSLSYAVLSELIQNWFISKRNGSWYDLIADSVGILFGLLAYYQFRKFIEQPSRQSL